MMPSLQLGSPLTLVLDDIRQRERESTLLATNIYRLTVQKIKDTQIKWQAVRTGMSPTSWPPYVRKHETRKVKRRGRRDARV